MGQPEGEKSFKIGLVV